MREILITGGSGFVASEAVKGLSSNDTNLTSPTQEELNVTDLDSIRRFVKNFDVVVNFAAFTNVKDATLDTNGPAWKLNVDAASNVARICNEEDKFLIHISTDSVFPIDSKGPHSEDNEIEDNPKLVIPYGYTKRKGEIEVTRSGVRAAILRIAYPFGNAGFPDKDYVTKLIKTIKLGYPLFDDQWLSLTYIRSLPKVIEVLAKRELPGIFHWVCNGLLTPYQVGMFINEKFNLGLTVKKGSLEELEKLKGKQHYAKFGGLTTEFTEDTLQTHAPSWQEGLKDFFEKDNTGNLTNDR